MAVANYESTYGHYPPAFAPGPDGRPWHSWRVLILPYIEQDPLFKRYRMDEPWDGPNNLQLADQMPRMFAFHGRHTAGLTVTNYLTVVGRETMWPGREGRRRSEIKSEPGSTVLIAENDGLGVHWMEPRDLDFDGMSYELNHPHGVSSWYRFPSAVMADGGLFTFTEGYDPATLRSMVTATRPRGQPTDPAVEPLPDGRQRERVKD